MKVMVSNMSSISKDPHSDLNDLSSNFPGTTVPFQMSSSLKAETPLTEDDIAKSFADEHSKDLRFDHDRGRWLKWNDRYWEEVKTGLAFHNARMMCRKSRGMQQKMSNSSSISGVEKMARSDPKLAVTSDIWDKHPYLLGTPTGTVDLVTGALLPSDPNNYITQSTTVTPAASGTHAPIFEKFLNEITGGDVELIRYLRRWFGYCLTGDTKLQCLLFIFGTGGNGKGILMNAIMKIMGTYSACPAMDTFAASKHPRHLTEMAMLKGKRLVMVSETEKGQAWSESRINQVTGGDPVTANFMRQDHFTYIPQFKLTISGNHKPKLKSVNEAAKRRYNIVPFNHKPPVPDPSLAEKLIAEYPAILRWMIDGCLDWQKNGLIKPEILVDTTSEYFEEQNLLAQWISSNCDTGPNLKCSATVLFESWKDFCEANKEYAGTNTAFGTMLTEQGFKRQKSSGTFYLGINIKSQDISMLNFDDKDKFASQL